MLCLASEAVVCYNVVQDHDDGGHDDDGNHIIDLLIAFTASSANLKRLAVKFT